jgi:hypothetical protein
MFILNENCDVLIRVGASHTVAWRQKQIQLFQMPCSLYYPLMDKVQNLSNSEHDNSISVIQIMMCENYPVKNLRHLPSCVGCGSREPARSGAVELQS